MLVVRHRVHPVEGVRHVDEPALAADLGDRLLECQPARDELLDEQPDHLALVGRLHLLGDDDLDPVGPLAGLQRARDLVVVGDCDRAQPALLRGFEQPLDRRSAIVGVVGVHVEVDVDYVAGRQPPADGAVARPVAASGDLAVERIELVRDARPLELWVDGLDPVAEIRQQVAMLDQPGELGGQRVRVARLEQQPAVAVGERLLVLWKTRRHGDRAAGHRAERQLRRRRHPGRRRHHDVGARQVLHLRALPRAGEAHAVADGPGQRRRGLGPRLAGPDGRLPGQVRRQPAQGAQEEAHRGALLLGHVEDLDELGLGLARWARHELRAGLDHAVVAREVASHEVAGGGEAGGAAVEAAEQERDQAARDLGREDSLRGRVERPDVQCPGMAERR